MTPPKRTRLRLAVDPSYARSYDRRHWSPRGCGHRRDVGGGSTGVTGSRSIYSGMSSVTSLLDRAAVGVKSHHLT